MWVLVECVGVFLFQTAIVSGVLIGFTLLPPIVMVGFRSEGFSMPRDMHLGALTWSRPPDPLFVSSIFRLKVFMLRLDGLFCCESDGPD